MNTIPTPCCAWRERTPSRRSSGSRLRCVAGFLLLLYAGFAPLHALDRPVAFLPAESGVDFSQDEKRLVEGKALYGQIPDRFSPAVASQHFPDDPSFSILAFDDFTVNRSALPLEQVIVFGVERGDPSRNRGVFLRIQSEPAFSQPGTVFVNAAGRQEGGNLIFDLPSVLPLQPGTYWVTAWVDRPFRSGGQWFWRGGRTSRGWEPQLQNPGNFFRMGVDPVAGSSFHHTRADLGFSVNAASADTCVATWGFEHAFVDITSALPQSGEVRMSRCDPLPMSMAGTDVHGFLRQCASCDDSSSQRFVRALTRTDWLLLTGGGELATAAGDNVGSSIQDYTSVYYVPPEDIAPGEERIVQIEAKMHHADVLTPPSHEPCDTVWDITVKRELTMESRTIDGVVVEKEKDEYVYTVTTTSDFCSSPASKEVVGNCLPSSTWCTGGPITGDWNPSRFLWQTNDYILLEGDGSDFDDVMITCEPDGMGCNVPGETTIGTQDELLYTWTASAGTFPNGNIGKDVAFKTPDEEGMVTVTLEIRNSSTRAIDPPLLVQKTFDVIEIRRRATVAAVAWIDESAPGVASLPLATASPPVLPRPTGNPKDPSIRLVRAPKYHTKAKTRLLTPPQKFFHGLVGMESHLFRRLPSGVPSSEGALHPWYHGAKGVRESGNPMPPSSLDDLDGLRNWMAGREFRSVIGFRVEAPARLDKILDVEIDDPQKFDLIFDEGWTPVRGFELIVPNKGIAWFFSGDWPPTFSRGERRNEKISITGICTEEARIEISQEFRLGPRINEINKLMTNRDAPWIEVILVLTLRGSSAASSSDLVLSGTGFPSYEVYFGANENPMVNIQSEPPGLSVIQFIDRGSKIDPGGV